MANRTFPELIGAIDKLAGNLKGRLGELPHLTPLQAEMEAWVIEARGLESKQGIFTARLQETNEQRRLVEIRGVDLHLRGSDALRSHFGGKAKTLHEFGVRPRRGGRRSTKPVPSPEPQPTPQPTATKTSAPQQPATPAPPVTPGSSA